MARSIKTPPLWFRTSIDVSTKGGDAMVTKHLDALKLSLPL